MSVSKGDALDELVRQYKSAMALFDIMQEMDGAFVEARHTELFGAMFNRMYDVLEEYEEALEAEETSR